MNAPERPDAAPQALFEITFTEDCFNKRILARQVDAL
jgi:hypothetical protein